MSNQVASSFPLDQLNRSESLNPAKWMHERIVSSIRDFEIQLDADCEVGARLMSFGSEMTVRIENVEYWGPDLIVFHGESTEGGRVQLLQHVSQLSVLLVPVQKPNGDARRIGFNLAEKLVHDRSDV